MIPCALPLPVASVLLVVAVIAMAPMMFRDLVAETAQNLGAIPLVFLLAAMYGLEAGIGFGGLVESFA